MPANSEVLPKQQPPDHSSATVESAIAVQPVVCEKTCSQDVADQTARGQNDISVAGIVAKSCSPRIDAPAASSHVDLIVDAKPSLSMLSRRAMPVVHEASRSASVITEPSVSGPVVDLDLPLIRRAAAFRIKYRRHEHLLRLPLEQVGFHPKNRDGQPPNGERCCQLAEEIARLGFDRDEADAGGVVVEQRPGCTTLPTSIISRASWIPITHPRSRGAFLLGRCRTAIFTKSSRTFVQAWRGRSSRFWIRAATTV